MVLSESGAPDGGGEVIRMKAEWSGLAFVEKASAGGHEIQAVGPAGVGGFGAILEAVQQGRKLDAQLAHAGSGDAGAFSLVAGAAEQHAVAHVGLHLPHIGGMGLEN